MSLLVLGLNHRTAPIEVRERIVFDAVRLPGVLAELAQVPGVEECMIVSTCNRTELYCVTGDDGGSLSGWLLAHAGKHAGRRQTACTSSGPGGGCAICSASPRASTR